MGGGHHPTHVLWTAFSKSLKSLFLVCPLRDKFQFCTPSILLPFPNAHSFSFLHSFPFSLTFWSIFKTPPHPQSRMHILKFSFFFFNYGARYCLCQRWKTIIPSLSNWHEINWEQLYAHHFPKTEGR